MSTQSPAHAVQLEDVTKSLGGRVVVDRVSLTVERGEFFSLLGPSGCGKTTTLRMLAGFEEPDAGAVRLGGADVRGVPPYRRDCNLVFQDYALFPHLTVGANVAFGLEMLGTPRDERAARVHEALAMVRLDAYAERRPHELSGGQRQRAAVARAIARRPALLLLDEPLGALDLQLRREMQVELKLLQRRLGTTFVYVTHDQEEALTMSDRVAVMHRGRVAQLGTPEELYEKPADAFVARFLGEANVLDGVVESMHADGARVACGTVRFVCSDRGRAPGSRVGVVVRPERVEVTRDSQGPLVVEESTFAGATVRHVLRAVLGGAPITVRRAADATPRIGAGDLVAIRVPPDAVRLVDPEPAA